MYPGYLTDIEGILVGHSEDRQALTGCSVILCPKGGTGGIDVRGSGPGTRETDIFDPKKTIDRIHGIVLSGGSAFGLDSASGVMAYLEEEDIGFKTVGVTVPIVSAAVIFDLHIGDKSIRPNKEMGYLAAKAASQEENRQGNIGCGMGASIGKYLGKEKSMKSGLGSATVEAGALKVSALVAVNSIGDIYSYEDGRQIAGVYDYTSRQLMNTVDLMKESAGRELQPTNTTIGVIGTNASLTKAQANKVSEMAHNGYARVINPVHTMLDGDTIFTLATNEIQSDINLVGTLAAEAMSKAIINGIKSAESTGGLKAYRDILK